MQTRDLAAPLRRSSACRAPHRCACADAGVNLTCSDADADAAVPRAAAAELEAASASAPPVPPEPPAAFRFYLHEELGSEFRGVEAQIRNFIPYANASTSPSLDWLLPITAAQHLTDVFLLDALRTHPQRTRDAAAADLHFTSALTSSATLLAMLRPSADGDRAHVRRLESFAPMLKARRRSTLRPGPPPSDTRSCRIRPRAAPGFGHPRPITRLEPRLVGQMGLSFNT